MNIIFEQREPWRISELISAAHMVNKTIVVRDKNRGTEIFDIASRCGAKINYPITYEDLFREPPAVRRSGRFILEDFFEYMESVQGIKVDAFSLYSQNRPLDSGTFQGIKMNIKLLKKIREIVHINEKEKG